MRLLVVGAGATGGYFGGRLAQAGREVTFLVRPGRLGELKDRGLRILSPHGNVTLEARLVTARQLDESFDAVLMAVKAYALDAAMEDVFPAVGPGTVILPVLNGLRHLARLAARFGEHAVLGGVCQIAAQIDAQGQIVQLTGLHELAYGELNGASSERTARLDAFLQGAGFDARQSAMIEQEMWEKWILLATIGGLTCLLRGDLGQIAAAPGGEELARQYLEEVVSIAAVLGHPPGAQALQSARAIVAGRTAVRTSSLYRDLVAGQPLEAEAIIGDLLARAQRAGVPAPLLATTQVTLGLYQRQRA